MAQVVRAGFDAHSASEIVLGTSAPWLLLSCEHASARLPSEWPLSPPEARLSADHWGWDLGAAELTRALADTLNADAILAGWSRLVADLNRTEDHPELCRPCAEGVEFSFNRALSPAQRQQRLAEVHRPFHRAYDELVRRRAPELLLSVHSFTPEYRGPQGVERRELEVGVLFDAPMAALGQALHASLERSGLRSELNQPYSGMKGLIESVQRHGRAAGVPYLEIEVRNDLLQAPADTERIVKALSAGLRGLRGAL